MQDLINSLVEANKNKDKEITKLKNRIDDLEQYTHRDDVIISGLATKPKSYARVTSTQPSQVNENTPREEIESIESQVLTFLNKKGIDLDPSEISACHPIKPKDSNKTPSIVMRLVSRKTKDRLLKNAYKLKEVDDRNRVKPGVYINEHLTTKNAHIAKTARALKKQQKLIGTWTRNGSVFVKRECSNGTFNIKIIKDVEALQEFIG